MKKEEIALQLTLKVLETQPQMKYVNETLMTESFPTGHEKYPVWHIDPEKVAAFYNTIFRNVECSENE